mmetsp:Transcript_102416/g.293166  ORF Transcript_102416/g.293166 Transcript_102416/m.293166 type:complete len:234 (+) Transcript_102416:7925-8626(+)
MYVGSDRRGPNLLVVAEDADPEVLLELAGEGVVAEGGDAVLVLRHDDAVLARPRGDQVASLLHVLELAVRAERAFALLALARVHARLAQRAGLAHPRRAAQDTVRQLLGAVFVGARAAHPVGERLGLAEVCAFHHLRVLALRTVRVPTLLVIRTLTRVLAVAEHAARLGRPRIATATARRGRAALLRRFLGRCGGRRARAAANVRTLLGHAAHPLRWRRRGRRRRGTCVRRAQ